jgi:hypothetical protein
MRTVTLTGAVDAVQLRRELAAADCNSVEVEEAESETCVHIPDDVDGARVDVLLRAHTLRCLVAAVGRVEFDASEYAKAETPEQLRSALAAQAGACRALQSAVLDVFTALLAGY